MSMRSCEALLEDRAQGITILSELLDTLVQLVERHLVLEEFPAELGLVVDVRDLGDLVGGRDGGLGVEQLRHGCIRVLEFFKQRRRDGQEIDTCKRLDLPDLSMRRIGVNWAPTRRQWEGRTLRNDAPMTMVL